MNETIDRRLFLKRVGIVAGGAAAVCAMPAVAGGATALILNKRPPKQLPAVQTGDVMTARAWNDLVERVNELSNVQ